MVNRPRLLSPGSAAHAGDRAPKPDPASDLASDHSVGSAFALVLALIALPRHRERPSSRRPALALRPAPLAPSWPAKPEAHPNTRFSVDRQKSRG